MSITEKQHYIPRFILNRHIDPALGKPLIHRYDKVENKMKPVSPATNCLSKYIYEFKDCDGRNNSATLNYIENTLSNIENYVAPIVGKVCEQEMLSEEECAGLYLFTGIQLLRTPEVLHLFEEQLKDHSMFTSVQARNRVLMLSLFPRYALKDDGALLHTLEWLCEYDLYIGVAADSNFLLSGSTPVCALFGFTKESTAHLIYYPVSSKYCLCFVHKPYDGPQYQELSPSCVNLLNDTSYEKSDRFVYSSNLNVLRGTHTRNTDSRRCNGFQQV